MKEKEGTTAKKESPKNSFGEKRGETKEPWGQRINKKIDRFLSNTTVTILFMLITFWALFADDLRVLCVGKKDDIMYLSLSNS